MISICDSLSTTVRSHDDAFSNSNTSILGGLEMDTEPGGGGSRPKFG